MKIIVKAKASAKEEKVEILRSAQNDKEGQDGGLAMTYLVVHVKEPAKEGRANWAIERALAKHFNVSPSRVRIISGQTSKTKIVEIN